MYGTRDEIPLSNKVFPWKQAPNKTLPTGINKTPAEHAADQARKAAGKKSDGQSVQTSVTPKKGQGVQEDLHELPADRIIGAELRRGVLDTHVVFQEMFQEPDEEYEYDMEALDVDPLPILTIHTTAKSEKFQQDASKALKRKNVFLAAEWLKTWAKHHHSCSKASTVLKQLSQLKINPDIDIVTAHEICVRAARFMMPDLARADRELIRALLNHRTDWHELRTERSLYDTNLAYRDLKTLFVPTQKKFKEEPEDTDYMVFAKEVIAEDKETYPKGKGRPFGKSRIALVLHNAMYEEGSMSTPVKGPSMYTSYYGEEESVEDDEDDETISSVESLPTPSKKRRTGHSPGRHESERKAENLLRTCMTEEADGKISGEGKKDRSEKQEDSSSDEVDDEPIYIPKLKLSPVTLETAFVLKKDISNVTSRMKASIQQEKREAHLTQKQKK